MFHPVSRVDRWEPLNAGVVIAIIVAWIIVAT
jgi:hypothetical protein